MNKGLEFRHQFTVDEKLQADFIAVSHDRNPLHVSDDFAKEKKFTGKVMHGNILNCKVSYLIGELLPLKNVMILSQDIKYIQPVYVNMKLELNAMVADFFDFIPGYEIAFTFSESESKQKVAKGKVLIKVL